MARKNTARKTVAAQPTVAIRLATGFDNLKDKAAADWRKPAHESNTKRAGAVAAVLGAGIALGVAFS